VIVKERPVSWLPQVLQRRGGLFFAVRQTRRLPYLFSFAPSPSPSAATAGGADVNSAAVSTTDACASSATKVPVGIVPVCSTPQPPASKLVVDVPVMAADGSGQVLTLCSSLDERCPPVK
jgi:hypothetical protein